MTDKRLSDNLPFVDETPSGTSNEFPGADPFLTSEKTTGEFENWPKLSSQQAKKEENNWAEYDQLKLRELLENERYRANTKHRKNLSTWAAAIVSFWLISVLLILTYNTSWLDLSDTVMVALLSTTTLNVLGMMVIVLRGLFENKD